MVKVRCSEGVAIHTDPESCAGQHEQEARAFLDDLKERMRKFELALHPDKTPLIASTATRPSNVRS
jgi:hypothetical protein